MLAFIIVAALGLLSMISEIVKMRSILFPLVVVGLLAALVFNVLEWTQPFEISYFQNMIGFEKTNLLFSSIMIGATLLWFLFAGDYLKSGSHLVDQYALILFGLTGALMLAGFRDMTTLFLGIETLSIPMYVLAASKKADVKSNEAGFKYLIMGSFASGFLLFGIALIYGATGSFNLGEMVTAAASNPDGMPTFFYVGIVLLVIAMAFKVGVAPFHFWTPDVYEGSPVLITGFMSTVVKTAAFAAFIRLFLGCFWAFTDWWIMILAALAALSMVVSNFSAVIQTNSKRMLAYSSISHAGFMLMIIMSNSGIYSLTSLVYYTAAYSLAGLVSFGVVYLVSKVDSEDISALNGLNKRNKLLALSMSVALMSLAGVPITAGFFAKYFVLSQIPSDTLLWLIILAVISSAVAAFYYVKLVGQMYFAEGAKEDAIHVKPIHTFVLVVSVVLILTLGLMPGLLMDLL